MAKLSLQRSMQCLDMEDYQHLHEATMQVLEEVGIQFHDDRALDLLKKHGAKIQGQTAYIPRKLMEDTLEAIPPTYEFKGRDAAKTRIIGKDCCMQTNAGCVFVQDMHTGPRPATLKDYANVQKLAQALPNLDIAGAHPVNPVDVPDKFKHLYMCHEILKNTDKPMLGFGMSEMQAKEFLDMVDIAWGTPVGQTKTEQHVNVSLAAISPLAFSRDPLGAMFEYCKRGQGVYVFTHSLAGVTAPIHMAGMGVTQNAECLAGVVLGRLINPECPMVYSPGASTVCMRNARPIQANPDLVRCNQFLMELAHNFYHIPCRTQSGMTDSKIVDAQAGLEAMNSILFTLMGQADIVLEAYGMMDNGMSTSLEMMVLCEEIVARARHTLKGIPVNEETLAVELIKEMGHMPEYLMDESTVDNFRTDEYYQNTFMHAGDISLAEWEDAGKETMEECANRRVNDILDAAPETLLGADIEKDLQNYMANAMA